MKRKKTVNELTILSKKVPLVYSNSMPDGVIGEACPMPPAIKLREFLRLVDSERNETILHEIMHICMSLSGLSYILANSGVDEEVVVNSLSPVLYHALFDNGLLSDWSFLVPANDDSDGIAAVKLKGARK